MMTSENQDAANALSKPYFFIFNCMHLPKEIIAKLSKTCNEEFCVSLLLWFYFSHFSLVSYQCFANLIIFFYFEMDICLLGFFFFFYFPFQDLLVVFGLICLILAAELYSVMPVGILYFSRLKSSMRSWVENTHSD